MAEGGEALSLAAQQIQEAAERMNRSIRKCEIRRFLCQLATLFVLTLCMFALLIAAAGCDQLREQPPPTKNSPVTFPIPPNLPEDRVTQIEFIDDRGGSSETVKGSGAGYSASGDKADANVDTTAPTANLSNGAAGSGGASKGGLSGQITDNQRQLFCIGIGAAGILAGLWLLSKGNRHGLAIAGTGGGLVAAGLMPAWFWPIVGLCALAAGVYWPWTSKLAADRKPESETLGIVLSAIDSSPDGVRSTVKQIVDKKADERHKNVIRKLTK